MKTHHEIIKWIETKITELEIQISSPFLHRVEKAETRRQIATLEQLKYWIQEGDDYNTCDKCGTIVIASDAAICDECAPPTE